MRVHVSTRAVRCVRFSSVSTASANTLRLQSSSAMPKAPVDTRERGEAAAAAALIKSAVLVLRRPPFKLRCSCRLKESPDLASRCVREVVLTAVAPGILGDVGLRCSSILALSLNPLLLLGEASDEAGCEGECDSVDAGDAAYSTRPEAPTAPAKGLCGCSGDTSTPPPTSPYAARQGLWSWSWSWFWSWTWT